MSQNPGHVELHQAEINNNSNYFYLFRCFCSMKSTYEHNYYLNRLCYEDIALYYY
jgi:hypothetical protein